LPPSVIFVVLNHCKHSPEGFADYFLERSPEVIL
jgi:hypothetical protein